MAYNSVTEMDLRTVATQGMADVSPAPKLSLLDPIRPNPFLPTGTLSYTLPHAGHFRLAICDVAGRVRALLVEESKAAGHHIVAWDGRDANGSELPSGVYLLRGEWADRSETRKLVLVR
jgi:hypothetical protein